MKVKEIKAWNIENLYVEYKTRIDKAIEYIENNTYEKSDNECGYTYDWNVRDLYDILNGKDE